MTGRRTSRIPTVSLLVLVAAGGALACVEGSAETIPDGAATRLHAGPSDETVEDSADRVAVISGLRGPESVRYDSLQDVYFVSNWNGGGGERDADGFISRVRPEGTVESLRFMTGTDRAPLHAPRGLYIVGDTLWAADIDGIHAFHRRTGEQLAFVDLSRFEPGFLNDVAAGPDGHIYLTDTGASRIYRIAEGEASVAVEDSSLGPPNGIIWDDEHSRFVLAPWGGRQAFAAWSPGTGKIERIARFPGGDFDGVEFFRSRMVVSSQADSSIHVLTPDGETRRLVRTAGRPADIGIDLRRGRVAVPYIDLDRVDIWSLRSR